MLSLFKKGLRLPFRRKLLLAQVSLELIIIHISLRLFSFSRVYRLLRRFQRTPSRPILNPLTGQDVCWAINRVGIILFRDNGCLTQALLGETLLIRAGVPAHLVIGVRKIPDGSILAHAWVESYHQILIGGKVRAELKDFQNFPELTEVFE